MELRLDGQVAIVTGASRGIGAAIADLLAQAGARVAGTATTDAGAGAIGERLREFGPDNAGYTLDVNDPDGPAGLVAAVGERQGAPTILVNNAGITRDQILLRMKDEDWDVIMETNLRSVFRMSKACLRGMMKARGGRIISIASVIGSMSRMRRARRSSRASVVDW